MGVGSGPHWICVNPADIQLKLRAGDENHTRQYCIHPSVTHLGKSGSGLGLEHISHLDAPPPTWHRSRASVTRASPLTRDPPIPGTVHGRPSRLPSGPSRGNQPGGGARSSARRGEGRGEQPWEA